MPPLPCTACCTLLLAACAGLPARVPPVEYHYDRNALTASQPIGESIIALTAAGHLLRFDRKTLRLTGEKLSERRALSLGPEDEGGLLVGFSNGHIDRLDPQTLEALFAEGNSSGLRFYSRRDDGRAGAEDRIALFSSGVEKLAPRLLAIVQQSPLADRARVMMRKGPPGLAPLVTLHAGALAAPYPEIIP